MKKLLLQVVQDDLILQVLTNELFLTAAVPAFVWVLGGVMIWLFERGDEAGRVLWEDERYMW